jgi:hypothetical protein
MDLMLQVLGGGFYLLNKIFLWQSERSRRQGHKDAGQRWRIAAWAVYLLGLPPWIIIFIGWRNWIAASVEASGAPSMVLGLVIAIRGVKAEPPRWLDHFALACIPLGFLYSLWDFGGFRTLNQWLETALVVGYLVGTYELAKERARGYLWFVLMHIACGWLMWIQGYPWLLAQQIVSLVFIIDAWRVERETRLRRLS